MTMAERQAGGSASDPNATKTVHAYISELQDLIKTAQEDWGLTAETQFSSDQSLAKSTKATDSANGTENETWALPKYFGLHETL